MSEQFSDSFYFPPKHLDDVPPKNITHGYDLSEHAVHLAQVHDAHKVITGESISILEKVSSLSLFTDAEDARKAQETGCTIDEAYHELVQPRSFVSVSLEEQKAYFLSLPLTELLEKSHDLQQIVEIIEYFFSAWVPALSKTAKGMGVGDYPFFVHLEHIRRGLGNLSRLALDVFMYRLTTEEHAQESLVAYYEYTPEVLMEEVRALVQERVLYGLPFDLESAYFFVDEVLGDTEDNTHHGLRLIELTIRSLSKKHADVLRLLDLEQEIFSALYLLYALPEEERPKVSPSMGMVPYVLYDLLWTKVFRGKKHTHFLLEQCEAMISALRTKSECEEATLQRKFLTSSPLSSRLTQHLRGIPFAQKPGKFTQESALSLRLQGEMTTEMEMPYFVTMHGVVGALRLLGKSTDKDDLQTFREAISLKKGPQEHHFIGKKPLTADTDIPPRKMEALLGTLPQDLVKLLKREK